MPVDQMNGIQLGIPGLMTQMPLKTVKDYENYVARLHGIPRVLDQVTADMRQGMADHLMPPRYLLDKVAAQCADIATKPLTSSPFAEPLQKFPPAYEPGRPRPADSSRFRGRSTTKSIPLMRSSPHS